MYIIKVVLEKKKCKLIYEFTWKFTIRSGGTLGTCVWTLIHSCGNFTIDPKLSILEEQPTKL